MEEWCDWGSGFFYLVKDAPKFFGFSDFLAATALLVLAWTISGPQYRFRLETAPFSVFKWSYSSVCILGFLTLATDFWRAQQLCVPKGGFLTPESWQLFLAGLYFLTFVTWLLFSFIKPSVFCRLNDERYFDQLKKIITRGEAKEIAVIAEELLHSAKNIVHHAIIEPQVRNTGELRYFRTTLIADKLLFLISDPRFCNALVANAPDTCIAFFNEVNKQKAFAKRMNILAKNIVNSALQNQESQLYHEHDAYESGYHGLERPFSNAIFSNHEMVEAFETIYNQEHRRLEQWNSKQWEVLCRVMKQTLEDYIKRNFGNQFRTFDKMSHNMEMATSNLYLINDQSDPRITTEPLKKTKIACQFIQDILDLFDGHQHADTHAQFIGGMGRPSAEAYNFAGVTTYYDLVAGMIYTVIVDAAKVRSPLALCEKLHRKIIWRCFFDHETDPPASSVIKQWVCLKVLDEINCHLNRPTYERAQLLGFCWSVMGIDRDQRTAGNCQQLKNSVLLWTQKNFLELHQKSPQMAMACLIDGLIFDKSRSRLVKPYPVGRSWHESERAELKLWIPGMCLRYIHPNCHPYRNWKLRPVTELI